MSAVAAAIAFFAFGALFTGSLLLLLLNFRSRSVRWWVLFQAANLLWLGAQGWAFATASWPQLGPLISGTVHVMPALFLAFALVDGYGRPDRDALLAVGLGLVTLPIDIISYRQSFADRLSTRGPPASLRAGTSFTPGGLSVNPDVGCFSEE
jgi:hypothetical protein